MNGRRRTILAVVLTGAVVLAGAVVAAVLASGGNPGVQGGLAGTATAEPDSAWDGEFQAYGDLSGAWSGGDGAQSLLLPDGATVWFFADSFLGPTGPDQTRSGLSTGIAHNSAVLYRAGHLGPTFADPPALGGYTGTGDYTWVLPPPSYPASRYELINGDQVIDDGTVYKFYQLADRSLHPAHFQYKLVGAVLESFTVNPVTDALTPAGGTPLDIEDTAASDPIIWGAATLVSGGYIYIYGVKPYNGRSDPFALYLARVPVGGLASGTPWQYFSGTPSCPAPSSAWSTDPRSATSMRQAVSAGFSVTRVNGTDVLLTNNASSAGLPPASRAHGTTNDAIAYYARCPTGFSPSSPVYLIYRPRLPAGYLAYEYRIVPQFSHGPEVLVSYSLNTIHPASNYADVTVYRPHFLDVRLPGIPGPASPVTTPQSGG